MTVSEFEALPIAQRVAIIAHISEVDKYGDFWRQAFPAPGDNHKWSVEIQCDDDPESKLAIANALQGMALDILKAHGGIKSLSDPSLARPYRLMEAPRGAKVRMPSAASVEDEDDWIPKTL